MFHIQPGKSFQGLVDIRLAEYLWNLVFKKVIKKKKKELWLLEDPLMRG